jgi:uncharacterized integral membrane protein
MENIPAVPREMRAWQSKDAASLPMASNSPPMGPQEVMGYQYQVLGAAHLFMLLLFVLVVPMALEKLPVAGPLQLLLLLRVMPGPLAGM